LLALEWNGILFVDIEAKLRKSKSRIEKEIDEGRIWGFLSPSLLTKRNLTSRLVFSKYSLNQSILSFTFLGTI
jgi:hypothetical protein